MTDNMPHLIGLGGKLRAGKDALGDYLEWEYGYVKMGMSDALNDALLKLNPIVNSGPSVHGHENYTRYKDLHDRVGYVEAKKNPEVRRLLQMLGTEVGREMISEDVWVDIAEKKIREHWANGKRVVITAMRFPNEISMLDRLGGVSLWVERPDSERLATGGIVSPEGAERISEALRAAPCVLPLPKGIKPPTEAHSAIQSHASETSVNADMFGYTIVNDGTLEDLYRKAEEILPGANARGWGQVITDDHMFPPYDR